MIRRAGPTRGHRAYGFVALAALTLTALTGCDDPQAEASLAVCLENRAADPRLAEILCEQSAQAAPDSVFGRRAHALVQELRDERHRREDAAYEARRTQLLAQNFVGSGRARH